MISSETKIIITIPIDRELKTKFAAKVVFIITRSRVGTANNWRGGKGIREYFVRSAAAVRVGSTGNQDERFVRPGAGRSYA